jgi:glucuronate isomerase
MGIYITDNFLLTNASAEQLFHQYAKKQPIIDYHNHLPPREIAEDKRWENITQVWLYGDHYKWRAMRANGIDERFVTGNATDREKFNAWAATVPKTLRNPLYHWTHMELQNSFGIGDLLLNEKTADEVWERTTAVLNSKELSCRSLLTAADVRTLCTTDDPTDSLEYHRSLKSAGKFSVQVLPTFRPDKAMAVENHSAFLAWVQKLAAVTNITIIQYSDLIAAIQQRYQFFHDMGCRLSDHGLEVVYAEDYTLADLNTIFPKALSGAPLTQQEIRQFKSALMFEFGLMASKLGWTQQFHIGPIRNVNSRMFRLLGPDTGYDTLGDAEMAKPLAKHLGRLDDQNALAKTIIYNINPRDNDVFAAMIGCFQDGSMAGKIQYGSAWWFLDQKDGIEKQLNSLSNMGLLSRFVGMLTDSRSFLSFSRHEYFRRVLCNMLGEEMENGSLPKDMDLVGEMVTDICYRNAKTYFGF